MKIVTGRERLELPSEFQDFLTKIGGRTPFGDPMFIVFWGQTRVQFGMLQDLGIPRWSLAAWEPAEKYGPEIFWPYDLLGPYPYRGEYEIIMPCYRKIGKRTEHMPLNYAAFEFLIPFILKHKNDSMAKRQAVMIEDKHKSDERIQNRIADVTADALPALGDQKGSVLRKKIEQIERNYAAAGKFLQHKPLGPSVA